MTRTNQLPHINTLSDIESHFKVLAGPGAGKTTWLSNHLKKVLTESDRLGVTRKIACITYTNVAAEEILKKMDCDKSRFEISTIHGFLYRNVVKPFAYLINKDVEDSLFNLNELSGHEEHIPRIDKINSWITTLEDGRRSYRYLVNATNRNRLVKCLSDLDWSFNGGEVSLKFRNPYSSSEARDIRLPTSQLLGYKHKYWQSGIMHHEDVLYFSYLIISNSERVLDFIRSKFPYIYIDEFQDTTELQTWIIKKIASSGTKIGVIGDLAQSIYKFAGAKRSDFENFSLEGLTTYELDKNHRSTQSIVRFLNNLRADIEQVWPAQAAKGNPVKVLVGSVEDAIQWLNRNRFVETYVLTRRNEMVETIKVRSRGATNDKLKEVYSFDSNSARVKSLHSIFMGYKLYRKGYSREAIKEITKPIRKAGKDLSDLQLRRAAIKVLVLLRQEEWRNKSLCEFYMDLRNHINQNYGVLLGAGLAAGSIKTFYQGVTVEEILPYVKVDTKSEDKIRTIHSAKGTEFDNVMVHFETQGDFEQNVLKAKVKINTANDDARLYYVGFSRAKKNLFINVPTINTTLLNQIHEWSLIEEVL
ncbi:UvrD-helicase domain-containing protein [Rufibacter immobilis]|uniref:UvrD-helicase domain-containing protein n=1 Tax=Rufibacter immobilis TaxID=1348778 RepID=UPI0035E4C66B